MPMLPGLGEDSNEFLMDLSMETIRDLITMKEINAYQ